jgi:preprotein translocase subunit SecF
MNLRRGWLRMYHGETEMDFIGRRKIWFAISGIVILISLLSLGIRGLNFGIEFKGGVQLTAPVLSSGPAANKSGAQIVTDIQNEVAKDGATGSQVQVESSGGQRNVIVQTATGNPAVQDKVVNSVASYVGANQSDVDSQVVGSTWGGEITSKAVKALIVFFIVIVAFIALRFEWKMAAAAFLALIHDLLITAGVYSLVGFSVTPSTIVAILTILGYSLYDTVVVFDKVEENTEQFAVTGRLTYSGAANLSMNQVFMRSLNTSLSTLLPTAALLFIGAGLLGASTLEDLALALLVGILSGTYSSIFVATPFLTILKERESRFAGIRSKLERDGSRPITSRRPVPAFATAEGSDTAVETETPPESVRPAPSRRPQGSGGAARPASSRSPAGSKKRKRRRR